MCILIILIYESTSKTYLWDCLENRRIVGRSEDGIRSRIFYRSSDSFSFFGSPFSSHLILLNVYRTIELNSLFPLHRELSMAKSNNFENKKIIENIWASQRPPVIDSHRLIAKSGAKQKYKKQNRSSLSLLLVVLLMINNYLFP